MKNKVIVVEDEPMIAETLCLMLDAHGCQTRSAANGRECLALMSAEAPDIVLTDVTMPEMDGLELLAQIKESDEYKSIPVIVLSNSNDDATISEVVMNGGRDYFVKATTPLKKIAEHVVMRLKEIS